VWIISNIVAALANSSLPTVLVATKYDAPEELRQLDPAGVAAAFPACAGHFKISPNAPGSTRESLHAMLRSVVNVRKGNTSTRMLYALVLYHQPLASGDTQTATNSLQAYRTSQMDRLSEGAPLQQRTSMPPQTRSMGGR